MSDVQEYHDLLKEAEDVVVSALADTMDLYGVTPSVGRLYGMLYFMDEPVTLDQMSEELGMSKPTMSTSIRSLQNIDMVHKVWKKGVRKDLYEAENKLQILLNNEDVPEEIAVKAKRNLAQIIESKHYYHFLKKVVKVFDDRKIIDILNEELAKE